MPIEEYYHHLHDKKKYNFVVIVETKNDAPMVWEQYLHQCSYEEALERMEKFKQRPDVIRVCIARLSYVEGHELLLERKDK